MNDNKMNCIECKATWGLGIVFSLRMFGLFMVLPALTTYGLSLQGANKTLIGIAIGIYGLTQAIFQIPFGLASDRMGRKPLIIFGLIIFIFGSIISAITTSIWGIILGRALQGCGAISSVIMALLSDLTREQNRTKAIALIGISLCITLAIAMVVGPVITNKFGLHVLFWILTFLAFVCILITLFIVPNTSNKLLNRDSSIVKSSIKSVLTNAKLFRLNISIFYLHTILMSNFVAFPGVLNRAGIPLDKQWKVYLVTILLSFLVVTPCIIYGELKRCMRLIFISCVTLILITEIILWRAGSHNLYELVGGIQLFFIAFNLMEAILPSLISKESPAGYKGTAMGVYSTSQFLGIAVGSTMSGCIYQHFGTSVVFLLGAIFALLWLFCIRSMQEPPYVTSLRFVLTEENISSFSDLEELLKKQNGVVSVLIIRDEKSAYVKIDSKVTNRSKLESILKNY